MEHRYQTYNPVDGTYGVRFANMAVAFGHAKSVSATFSRECWVMDTETGEILAMYDNGAETYMA